MGNIELPDGYIPNENEEFMNPLQLEYFKRKLIKWKEHLIEERDATVEALRETSLPKTDLNDRASDEAEISLDVNTKDRTMRLIAKIDHALKKIEDGTYGYCEFSGEPISIERLKARPIATLSIESQEEHERYERGHVS